MANAIPLLGGTDAAGGYLVPDSWGPMLVNGINRESAVAALATIDQVSGDHQKYPVYVGRPTAAFTAEGAAKAVTGAEFALLEADVKKITSTIIYTQEFIEDAKQNPSALLNSDVRGAFAELIDQHALGRTSSGTIVSQFNSELTETTQEVELGTDDDALALAVSSAMGKIEANGYVPNGIILANDGRVHLRDARGPGDNAAIPVYTAGFVREPDAMYGLPIRYSTNLQTFAGAAGAGRVVGLVGDFTRARVVMRKDITTSVSSEATVDVGGTLHHLWQQNKTAVLWEMRVGFVAHDLNKAFCRILNAA